jgi:hypothetical protein
MIDPEYKQLGVRVSLFGWYRGEIIETDGRRAKIDNYTTKSGKEESDRAKVLKNVDWFQPHLILTSFKERKG